MARATKRSAGVVVVHQSAALDRFLLLRSYNYWDFPKGEVEAGEAPLAAAIRETREETALEDLEFAWGETFIETEPYSSPLKIARFYLARTTSAHVRLPVSPELGRPEHGEFRWLAYAAAHTLLVPRMRRVLDWAQGVMAGAGRASAGG